MRTQHGQFGVFWDSFFWGEKPAWQCNIFRNTLHLGVNPIWVFHGSQIQFGSQICDPTFQRGVPATFRHLKMYPKTSAYSAHPVRHMGVKIGVQCRKGHRLISYTLCVLFNRAACAVITRAAAQRIVAQFHTGSHIFLYFRE